jgi:hypothetical protein
MKTKYLLAGLFVLCLAAPTQAQDRFVLAQAYDLDGEAADVDQVVTAAQLVDSKDDYTIAANPDTCRVVDITIVDADSSITAGVATITGTDCLGEIKSVAYTITGGSGVKSAQSTYKSAYFRTVTKVENGVLTGESGAADTMAVGYSTASPAQRTAYGTLMSDLADTYRYVDVGRSRQMHRLLVTTSASFSTALTEVTADDDPFDSEYVNVNDILIFNLGDGVVETRKVASWTNDSNVVLDNEINIPAAGVTFRVLKFFESSDPYDIFATNVGGYDTATFGYSVDGVTSTTSVIYLLQCMLDIGTDFPNGIWYQVATDTVLTGATQAGESDSIDFRLVDYNYCEVSWQFTTGDDDDTGVEDLNAVVVLGKDRP